MKKFAVTTKETTYYDIYIESNGVITATKYEYVSKTGDKLIESEMEWVSKDVTGRTAKNAMQKGYTAYLTVMNDNIKGYKVKWNGNQFLLYYPKSDNYQYNQNVDINLRTKLFKTKKV